MTLTYIIINRFLSEGTAARRGPRRGFSPIFSPQRTGQGDPRQCFLFATHDKLSRLWWRAGRCLPARVYPQGRSQGRYLRETVNARLRA